MKKRYLLNKNTGEVHDTRTLSEKCNVDQIKQKRKLTFVEFVDFVALGDYDGPCISPCKHCTR